MALGIGTILSPEETKGFLDAGADFVVQPVTTASVGETLPGTGHPVGTCGNHFERDISRDPAWGKPGKNISRQCRGAWLCQSDQGPSAPG